MPRPSNRAEFLELLKKSQLLAQRHFHRVREYAWDHDELDDPERLAAQLIAGRVLTGFHASQLLRGRYRGFYVGSYKLLNLLGQGGMGRVYLAEQVRLQRLVALKVLRKSMILKSNQTVTRFRREAKTVALLRHANIIQAFDYDEIDGVPFIVMEYVEGLDLGRMKERLGRIPWPQAVDIVMQAASGLQHAHEHGLVHRDVKPANLLIDPQGIVKILDLGLVSDPTGRQQNALTNDGDQLGTIDYIAPEQALNSRTADVRADIYSLGAVFYTIVTGSLLFPGRNTTEKLLLHQTDTPVPIQSLVSDLPDELVTIVEKMLAKRPHDRFETPQDVADQLAPFAERSTPPYDLGWIKYRASERADFLDRSPRASSINVRRSTAAPPIAIEEESAELEDALPESSRVEPGASSVVQPRAAVSSITENNRLSRLIRIGMLAAATILLVALAVNIPGFMSAAETETAPRGDNLTRSASASLSEATATPNPGPVLASRPPRVIAAEQLPFLVYCEDNHPSERPFDGEAGIMGPNTSGVRQDFAWADQPYSGQHCLRIEFSGNEWGGVTWQTPANNWGSTRGGYDLSATKQFSFWARGDVGGEVIEFKMGSADPSQAFPDSASKSTGKLTLTTEWQRFEIPTSELDMSEIKVGFIWVTEQSDAPIVFYLDDIVYE